MRLNNAATALALGIFMGIGAPAWAQNKTDFAALQSSLKQKDNVTLTTVGGDKIKGRLLEIAADRIVLQLKGGPQTVSAEQVQKVQKSKNGVALGAVIGLGAAIPFTVALSSYASNEGGGAGLAAIPIVVGLGAGVGIDAAIGSSKTLYERNPGRTVSFAPLINPKTGIGGRVAFRF